VSDYLLGSGADIKTVQNRLGHKSATMTLDQYGHAMPERDQEAAMTISNIMSAAQEKATSESQSEQAA